MKTLREYRLYKARENTVYPKIVGLSADDTDAARETWVNAGVECQVHKPISLQKMKGMLQEADICNTKASLSTPSY